MTHALIDADLVAFRVAATCNDLAEPIALSRAERLVETILHDVSADSYSLYLTGKGNFRKTIDTQYKANRKGKDLPEHLQACRKFLTENFDAEVCEGHEADDALGYNQDKDTVICSLDKDLLQVPGWHYNWSKQEATLVTPQQGFLNFWLQTLVGDRSDNITGVQGIGPVKAKRALEHLNPWEYYDACLELYKDDQERLNTNCKLLWVWRTYGEVWTKEINDQFALLKWDEETLLSYANLSLQRNLNDCTSDPVEEET